MEWYESPGVLHNRHNGYLTVIRGISLLETPWDQQWSNGTQIFLRVSMGLNGVSKSLRGTKWNSKKLRGTDPMTLRVSITCGHFSADS